MRQNERQSEESRAWAIHWGFTNCHSQEGERALSKEWSYWSVLWIRSLFLPPQPPTQHLRLDKSRTSCSCYGRKRRKCAESLGDSMPAGQNQKDSHQEPARCVHADASQLCLCVWIKHGCFPLPNHSNKFHYNVSFHFPCEWLLLPIALPRTKTKKRERILTKSVEKLSETWLQLSVRPV